jgi:hypothetical protein
MRKIVVYVIAHVSKEIGPAPLIELDMPARLEPDTPDIQTPPGHGSVPPVDKSGGQIQSTQAALISVKSIQTQLAVYGHSQDNSAA